MGKWVALFRAINVGGRNLVPMAELRSYFVSIGCTDVESYIQSGNVVYRRKEMISTEELEKSIAREFRISPLIVQRNESEMARIVERNPFDECQNAAVHVGFMKATAPLQTLDSLDEVRFLPERYRIDGEQIYLYLPRGMGEAKLPDHFRQRLSIPTTFRNWKTVCKLHQMMKQIV